MALPCEGDEPCVPGVDVETNEAVVRLTCAWSKPDAALGVIAGCGKVSERVYSHEADTEPACDGDHTSGVNWLTQPRQSPYDSLFQL